MVQLNLRKTVITPGKSVAGEDRARRFRGPERKLDVAEQDGQQERKQQPVHTLAVTVGIQHCYGKRRQGMSEHVCDLQQRGQHRPQQFDGAMEPPIAQHQAVPTDEGVLEIETQMRLRKPTHLAVAEQGERKWKPVSDDAEQLVRTKPVGVDEERIRCARNSWMRPVSSTG